MMEEATPTQYQAWLPESALKDTRLLVVLEEVASGWAKKWFVQHSRQMLLSQKDPTLNDDDVASTGGWSCDQERLCLTSTISCRREIASRMLDIDVSSHRLTSADGQLIGRLTRPVLEDLMARLAGFLRIQATPDRISAVGLVNAIRRPVLHFKLTLGAPGSTVDFFIDRATASAARRALTKPKGSPIVFGSKQKAIGSQEIRIGAKLGTVQLSYADLQGLGIGDTLVFDKRLEQAIDLTINQSEGSGVACEIHSANEKINLKLISN